MVKGEFYALQRTMELLTCDGCMEDFNTDSHRPKALKCGHSLCSQCVLNGMTCVWHTNNAIDSSEIEDDNDLLLQLKNLHVYMKKMSRRNGGAHIQSLLFHRPNRADVKPMKALSAAQAQKQCKLLEKNNNNNNKLQVSGGGDGDGGEVVRAGSSLRVVLTEEKFSFVAHLDLGEEGEESRTALHLLYLLEREGRLVPKVSNSIEKRVPDKLDDQRLQAKVEVFNVWTQTEWSDFTSPPDVQQKDEEANEGKCHNQSTCEKEQHLEIVEEVQDEEVVEDSYLHVTDVKQMGRLLMRLLFRHHVKVHEQRPPPPFSLSPSSFANPSLASDLVAREEAALSALQRVLLQRTMAELRDVRWFCLIIDTTSVPNDGRSAGIKGLVSMLLRYCRSDGEPVERLVSLLDAHALTGMDIYKRFNTLCKEHHVDWPQTLCGVSLDTDPRMQRPYTDLFSLLRMMAPRIALTVNGAHRLWDLIAGACRTLPAGINFFDTLDMLSSFFGQIDPSTLGYYFDSSGPGGLDDDETGSALCLVKRPIDTRKMIELLSRGYGSVRAMLCSAQNSTDASDSRTATLLLVALSQVEFLAVAFLFFEVASATRPLVEQLERLPSSASCLGDVMLLVLDDLRFKLGPAGLSFFLSRAQQYASGFKPAPLPHDPAGVTTTLSLLARMTHGVLSSRINDSIGALRDLEVISTVCSLPSDNSVSRSFQTALRLSKREYCQELISASSRARRDLSSDSGVVSCRDAVVGLMKLWDRAQFAVEYPYLYGGLQMVCALPLLPGAGGLWKLRVLRDALLLLSGSGAITLSVYLLESRLMLKCWLDSDDGEALLLQEDIADEAFELLVEKDEVLRKDLLRHAASPASKGATVPRVC